MNGFLNHRALGDQLLELRQRIPEGYQLDLKLTQAELLINLIDVAGKDVLLLSVDPRSPTVIRDTDMALAQVVLAVGGLRKATHAGTGQG